MDYKHKDVWNKTYNEHNFSIEVVRWSFDSSPYEHNWNVYAYLYPKHPLFVVLRDEEDKSTYSDSLDDIPFHCGCTLRQYIKTNEDECVKIGSDYQHYMDDRFRQYKTKEQALEVFVDAERLARYLIAYGKTEPSSEEQNP